MLQFESTPWKALLERLELTIRIMLRYVKTRWNFYLRHVSLRLGVQESHQRTYFKREQRPAHFRRTVVGERV